MMGLLITDLRGLSSHLSLEIGDHDAIEYPVFITLEKESHFSSRSSSWLGDIQETSLLYRDQEMKNRMMNSCIIFF